MTLSERWRLRGALVVAALFHGALALLTLRAPGPELASRRVDAGTDHLLYLDESWPGARTEAAGPAVAVAGEPSAGAVAGHASGQRLAFVDRSSRSVAAESTPGEGKSEPDPAAPEPTDSAPGA